VERIEHHLLNENEKDDDKPSLNVNDVVEAFKHAED